MAKIIVSEPQHIVLGISFNNKKQLLVNLNKCKNGSLEWRVPGGKIEEGLSPYDSLKKEYKEEFGREITIVGTIGKLLHEDFRGSVLAEVCRTTVLGELSSVKTYEPTEIIECRWIERYEFPSLAKQGLDGYPFSPLSWKVVSSICGMYPWENKFLKGGYKSYFL